MSFVRSNERPASARVFYADTIPHRRGVRARTRNRIRNLGAAGPPPRAESRRLSNCAHTLAGCGCPLRATSPGRAGPMQRAARSADGGGGGAAVACQTRVGLCARARARRLAAPRRTRAVAFQPPTPPSAVERSQRAGQRRSTYASPRAQLDRRRALAAQAATPAPRLRRWATGIAGGRAPARNWGAVSDGAAPQEQRAQRDTRRRQRRLLGQPDRCGRRSAPRHPRLQPRGRERSAGVRRASSPGGSCRAGEVAGPSASRADRRREAVRALRERGLRRQEAGAGRRRPLHALGARAAPAAVLRRLPAASDRPRADRALQAGEAHRG